MCFFINSAQTSQFIHRTRHRLGLIHFQDVYTVVLSCWSDQKGYGLFQRLLSYEWDFGGSRMTRKVITGTVSTSDNLNPALRRHNREKHLLSHTRFIHKCMRIIGNSFTYSRIIQLQNLHSTFINVWNGNSFIHRVVTPLQNIIHTCITEILPVFYC